MYRDQATKTWSEAGYRLGEVEASLPADAPVVASKIRSVDRELDQLEEEREESIVRGMRAPVGAFVVNKWGQDRADGRRERLLEERAELVRQLKQLLGDD